MIGIVRQILGLVIIAGFAILTYVAFTANSRARLHAAVGDAVSVANAEAALLGRMDEATSGKTDKAVLPQDMIWQGDDPAVIEIGMQQTILDAARDAGLQVVAFGAGVPPGDVIQPTIGYEVELEGGHVEVARFLALLENAQPGLAIATLWMRQLPPAEGMTTSPISLRMAAWGFRDAKIATP